MIVHLKTAIVPRIAAPACGPMVSLVITLVCDIVAKPIKPVLPNGPTMHDRDAEKALELATYSRRRKSKLAGNRNRHNSAWGTISLNEQADWCLSRPQ
jgi:hypothetical protein